MLSQAVETYLAVRRAAGFELKNLESYLCEFARFATACGDTHVVTHTAIVWATGAASEAQRHTRLLAVIRFARFMRSEDPRHQLPPADVFSGRRQRPTPYIFTEAEIQRIVAYARRLGPSDSPATPYPTVRCLDCWLLPGCGPRKRGRCIWATSPPKGSMIRQSKFKKSRIVPLHETTHTALAHYLKRRRQIANQTPHLFVSLRRRMLSHTVVAETFQQVLQDAGIPAAAGTSRPRLMDLRHTFAVRGLESCPDGRDHVGRHMLALTTYMGHSKVKNTYWYLENTPELMADMAQCCEAFVYGGKS